LFDVLLHASLLGLACLAIGWARIDFDRHRPAVRAMAWGIAFSTLAVVAMLSPFEALPGLRIDIRATLIVLSAVFGGPGAVVLTAAVEIAVRLWLGGPLAIVGTAGIVLSFLPAIGYALAGAGRPRLPGFRTLALFGLMAGAAGPAASFIVDFDQALRLLGAGAPLQIVAVFASTLLFAGIIRRTDRARRSVTALREREEHLTEANRQLVELTVQLERRNQDYAEARNHAEDLLAQMNAIFENAPFGIFIKEMDGKTRAANAAYARLMCQPMSSLIGERSDIFLAPVDAARARETDALVARTGEAQTVEYHTLTPGSPEWLWTIKFPIKDAAGEVTAIGGFDLDVTLLKQQTIALERSALQLRRMHEIAKIIYWYHEVGPDGRRRRLAGMPDDFIKMSGWPAAVGLDSETYLTTCIHPMDHDRMREIYRAFNTRESDSYTAEYTIVRPDRSLLPVKVWIQRVHEAGSGGEYIMGVMQDVGAQHEREAHLADAMSRAEMSDRVKTEFLANLSHELRTPLNAIIGFAELMKLKLDHRDYTGFTDYTDLIVQGGQRLLAIVSQLLEIARLDFGARELTEVSIEVAETVASCVAQVEERFATKGVAIRFTPAETDIILRGERAYFIKALIAVLTNAAQHSPRSAIVHVATAMTATGDLEISVEDSGPGIPADLLPRLTDPFVHGESAFTRKRDGAGLGLAMCSRILEMHGGRLTIDSVPDARTRVALVYPAARLAVATLDRGSPELAVAS
jgi:signal transduction histidine kinase